jgi:outer membrane protein assembly factor BamB
MRSIFLVLASLAPGTGGDWPDFRGPDSQGHADGTGIPLTFGEKENLRWKTMLPGRGWSSPVSDGRLVWVTTALDAPPAGKSLRALAVDVQTGQVRHDVEVFRVDKPLAADRKNSHASPSPLLDGPRVYVHFGSYGTACLDTHDSKVIWRSTEHRCDHQVGPGGSPVLYEDLLIVPCDGTDVQFVAALDKLSGRTVWKTTRTGRMSDLPSERKSFCTPLVVKVAGRDLLISPGAFHIWAYEPRTGKEVWRLTIAPGFSTVPRPVYGHGLLYLCTGYWRPGLLAVRPDGTGDITATHVAWKFGKRVPTTPSPLLVGEELYLFADDGFATCLDARTGMEVWVQRLGGKFWSSPVLVEGRIFIANEDGKVFVLQPGRQYKQLAVNELEGQLMASPAVVSGALFLRTDQALYCFAKR